MIGNMKVYEIDTFVVQKVMNKMMEENYSNNTIKKNKHLISQFFEYAIDNKWVQVNPTLKIKLKIHDRKTYDTEEKYKALTPEVRTLFLEKLNKDESNFLKPMCITMMFAGLRVGEVIALTWRNVDFENKTLKIERAITQVPKFDSEGNIVSRVTVVGDTKTTCSVREIPVADIVIETLKEWKEKQVLRQKTNRDVKADITAPTAFVFANDDGSVRTYSGCRKIFDRFKRRNNLNKYHIHFHGLRHTISNMLFELNENPKVIQQLLGHHDVTTTISIYNNVNSDYVRESTSRLNEKLNQNEIIRLQNREQEKKQEQEKKSELSDEEFDQKLAEMLRKQEEHKRRRREKDF